MTTSSSISLPQDIPGNSGALAEAEPYAVASIADKLDEFGIPQTAAVGAWVALKSKPMVIVYGPKGRGKDTILISIARAFCDDQTGQLQQFQGHPWWATKGSNMGLLTRAQQRLTSYRLRFFLEEASLAQGDAALFFAVFSKISRAELSYLFIPLPGKTIYGHFLRFPSDLVDDWVPFPQNLYLLASIDHEKPWMDVDVARNASLLCDHVGLTQKKSVKPKHTPITPIQLQAILYACRRFDPEDAWANVPTRERGFDPLRPIRECLALLNRHKVRIRMDLIRDAYLYIGNAWSVTGQGLFEEDPSSNANSAFGFWLKNSALPQLSLAIHRNPDLLSSLHQMLAQQPSQTSDSLLQILDDHSHYQGV